MKFALPIIVLSMVVLACGRFGNSWNTVADNSPSPNSSPTPIVKAVDIPGLIGKSTDEVKKLVPVAPKSETPWLEYELPQGDLTIWYTKGKQTRISFTIRPVRMGSQSASGFSSPEKLGDLVGIDVHGKPVPPANGSFCTYKDVNINGKPREVTFSKIGESFNGVSLSFD